MLASAGVVYAQKPAAKAPAAAPAQSKAKTVAAVAKSEPAKPATTKKIDPLDWPTWRGPEQNGISRETGLPDSWDAKSGKNLLWKNADLRTRSTPIIMHGKLYTLASSEPGTHAEGEKVICADAATGKILWENKFNVYLSDVPDTRVAWSCCVGDPTTGRVYAMGVCGYFQCIDGDTGKTLWSHSLSEEFGLLSTYGGRTNVPVIFDDLVLISAVCTSWGDQARPVHRFLAFNKATGELVWTNGTRPLPDDTTYSTPFLAVVKGQPLMVFGSGDGSVWAFQPRTGKPVWSFRFSLRGLNVSPLVDGETVYMGQSEENWDDSTMGALGAFNAVGMGDITKSNQIWRHKEIMVGKSSPLLLNGRLYGLDDSNIIYVVDAATGEEIGKRQRMLGTITRASPTYADGKIFACTTSAFHVLTPTENGVKIAQRQRFPDGEEIYGSTIVSHGRIYVPTTSYMYCIGNADAKPAADPPPAPPAEAELTDKSPALVQVVPAEALIKPGEKISFKTRLYNAIGQLIKETEAAYAVDGPAEITPQGQLTAQAVTSHAAATITAKVGELTGTARIRIEPPLPWKFDFTDGQVPVTWVGARVRHQTRDLDGDKVLVKVTTVPKGTRSQAWMGPTDLHDYTIQADVRGSKVFIDVPIAGAEGASGESDKEKKDGDEKDAKPKADEKPAEGTATTEKSGKMPDIGLIAQRYTLDLMGAKQQVEIRSWTSVLDRFSKQVPFPWKPDTWYTMKFQANVIDGKAVLKGKVWPRGESEPSTWTIEATDEYPNVQGSPGLFGNASSAELFYDNITVTPTPAK